MFGRLPDGLLLTCLCRIRTETMSEAQWNKSNSSIAGVAITSHNSVFYRMEGDIVGGVRVQFHISPVNVH